MHNIEIESQLGLNIPFVTIIAPIVDKYINNRMPVIRNCIFKSMRQNLYKDLSWLSEIVIQKELDDFVKCGNTDYNEFADFIRVCLPIKYPVLYQLIKLKSDAYLTHIENILQNFEHDYHEIRTTFNINSSEKLYISDIQSNLGDSHGGKSTSMVFLSNGYKLIYKPRNMEVTIGFNKILEWTNAKMNSKLKTVKAICYRDYGWMEYVPLENPQSIEDLEEYYYHAGIVLFISFILGSKDCHKENLIASRKTPVLIDHETVIQPFLENFSKVTWGDQNKIPEFSVLESILIANLDQSVAFNIVGFGIKSNCALLDLENQIINPNTIQSKRVPRFVVRNPIEKNIPKVNNKYAYANEFASHFHSGFCNAYDLFFNLKNELQLDSSPLRSFVNKEIRYVWRPTFVYFKILKFLRHPKYLSNFESFNSKLSLLLSKAYAEEQMKQYTSILSSEFNQMQCGEIPIFSMNSNDYCLDINRINIFKYNPVEHINKRLDLLSAEDKKKQLEYIDNWLNIC